MKKTNASRRRFLKGSAATAAGMALGGNFFMNRAFAQSYPSQSIEALIPFSPGGGTDRSVRVVAPAWEDVLGMSRGFRLNHKPGAGTLIAQNLLQRADHDGSTVLFTPAPYVAWLSVLEEDKFSEDQIAWLGSYFQDPNVLLVPKDSPYQSAQEFIDAARESDKPFTASVSAPMSASHAASVVLRERAGINLKIVPFAGGGSAARNAVAGGHVDCCMAPYWSAINILDLVRGLAIFWPEDPSTGLWDAPPANEVLDFEMPHLQEPYGVVVPAQMRADYPDRYKKLASTFQKALTTESFKQAAKQQNLNYFVDSWGPEKCEKWIADYLALLASYRPAMIKDIEAM